MPPNRIAGDALRPHSHPRVRPSTHLHAYVPAHRHTDAPTHPRADAPAHAHARAPVAPPHLVGLANGVAQSIVSLARFLGPILGGTVRLRRSCAMTSQFARANCDSSDAHRTGPAYCPGAPVRARTRRLLCARCYRRFARAVPSHDSERTRTTDRNRDCNRECKRDDAQPALGAERAGRPRGLPARLLRLRGRVRARPPPQRLHPLSPTRAPRALPPAPGRAREP